ncbi:superoxide dismutase family protein [Pseudonocardia nigra]|uniref:superoxide dismutase family protein n=1 Tax=Pseudonocardia nigra TaxID=1921578 RepID=UPI001C5D2F59|nr:superoxide dismutase family protein [Pseudonocardia nigra]
MKLNKLWALGAAVALPLLVPGTASAQESVQIQLDALNNSGASGTATLTPTSDGGLRVQVESSGLVPGAPHAQHLHGGFDGTDFMCPPASADSDGDGFVSTVEGLPAYGDIQISLTTEGDTTAASGLALDRFPVADDSGNLTYERTIPAGMLPDGTLEQLANLHIVQHGIDVNGNGMYDLDGLGESPLAMSLGLDGVPAEGTFPATCGMVAGAAAATMPDGGVETGDGSAADDGAGAAALAVVGGAALLGAGGVAVWRRRAGQER